MGSAASGKTPAAVHAFFAMLFFAFTCVFPYLQEMNNPNENSRTFMTMAIVEEGTFCIDSEIQRYGANSDLAIVPDPATNSRHVFSLKGPGTSYTGVPFYWAFTKVAPLFGHTVPTVESSVEDRIWWLRTSTFVLRLFAVQLPCFFFLVWFERFLRNVTNDSALRLSAVAAVGVGTNYLAYSLMYASHAATAAAAFMGFALIYRARITDREKERNGRIAFLSAFFLSLATLFEYPAVTISVVLAVYGAITFRKPKKLALFALGGILNVAAVMFFQWRAFGSPWTPGHKFAASPRFHAALNRGLYGLEGVNWAWFRELSLSREFGFFGMSPYMWLGVVALVVGLGFGFGLAPTANRERRIATVVWGAAMVLLWLGVSSRNIDWRGGWTVGPRYLAPASPFFAFGALCLLEAFAAHSPLRRSLARGVAGGLAFAGALTIGVVGLELNSVTEKVARPLIGLVVPLLRAGFVPYHVGDLLGWRTPTPWFIVCGSMLGAVLLAGLVLERDTVKHYVVRFVAFSAALGLGILGAFSTPDPNRAEPPAQMAVGERAYYANIWEPKGRDDVALLRAKVNDPARIARCDKRHLATLERGIGELREAVEDERGVRESIRDCP